MMLVQPIEASGLDICWVKGDVTLEISIDHTSPLVALLDTELLGHF